MEGEASSGTGEDERRKKSLTELWRDLNQSQSGTRERECEASGNDAVPPATQEVGSSSGQPVTLKDLEREMTALQKEIKKEVVENPMEKYRELEKAILAYGDFCLKKKKKKSVEPFWPEMEPDLFLCKFSHRRMEEPVTIASGESYERSAIKRLLQGGLQVCPHTGEKLTHFRLTHNHLLRNIIRRWCEDMRVCAPPPPIEDPKVRQPLYVLEALADPEKLEKAALDLELLSRRSSSFRKLLGENPNYVQLLDVHLQQSKSDSEERLRLQTAIQILCIDDNSNFLSIYSSETIFDQAKAALVSGDMQSMTLAAGVLFRAADSKLPDIVMDLLVKLLGHGDSVAKKEAASVIYIYSGDSENMASMLSTKVVEVLLGNIGDNTLVAPSLALLERLSRHREAIKQMVGKGAVSIMMKVIKNYPIQLDKEAAVRILAAICEQKPKQLKRIRRFRNDLKVCRNGGQILRLL